MRQKELMRNVYIDIDVGSTTVKEAVVEAINCNFFWHDYQRHHTRYVEMVLSFLLCIRSGFPTYNSDDFRVFIIGSSTGSIVLV